MRDVPKWILGAADAGVHPVKVRVIGPPFAFDTQNCATTLEEDLNVAPVISSAPVMDATVGKLCAYDGDATDDEDSLT